MIDWDRPIFAKFSESPPIRCFTIGKLETGNMMVGVPDPSDPTKGIMLEINNNGETTEGRPLIENGE